MASEILKEGLFSKKRLDHIRESFWEGNPISNQVLGICSALAVTVKVDTAIVMVLALTFVLCLSNVIISSLRKFIPGNIRIIVFLVVIASAVAIADEVLKAFMYDISKQLSVFVGLIITNCIVMGRAEAFAMGNGWWDSLLDAFGNAMGYGMFLIMVAVPRELFGSGSILGYQIVPQPLYDLGYVDSGFMLLAPAAFILLGLFIWAQKTMVLARAKGGR
ncbi:MAG: NADH:ubiquinone reductase (Na(+)-transporting) subunit D [Chitinivibrionales bacterium]|nr:NADH:ubiquinone reductase (Na(+)-transporting) subunit D [Chitinivibrionales bacterium]